MARILLLLLITALMPAHAQVAYPHVVPGVELEFPPRYIESIALKIAFFTDPSGVRVELTEGLDLY